MNKKAKMGVAQDNIYSLLLGNKIACDFIKSLFILWHFCLLSRFLVKSGISEPQHSANDTLKNDALLHFHFRPVATYHGLPTPNETFFHWNPELLGLGRQIGQIFGVFLAKLSAPILVQCFPLFNHYFYKKLSLYIHISNIYLELGFEFGQPIIRDLAFVCP